MAMDLKVNFAGITDMIGTAEGISDATEDKAYIDGIITAAHRVASLEFDVTAASAAAAGTMTHMYEFGTQGITRGTPKFGDPTSLAARLWVHELSGEGKNKTISFNFRPALAPNPKPSSTFYGVENSVIRKLSRRNYVFRQKAAINELGLTVDIKPKDKPFNFVPFYGKQARNPENEGRTHVFFPREKGPMKSTPGLGSENSGGDNNTAAVGTFTAFWQSWWNGEGRLLLSAEGNDNFNKDVAYIIHRFPKTHGNLESVIRYNSRGRVYNRRRKVKARMTRLGAQKGINRRR